MRKSSVNCPAANGPAAIGPAAAGASLLTTGSSDQGNSAASARPSSVPGTVMRSGIVCSSKSMTEAVAMSAMSRRCTP